MTYRDPLGVDRTWDAFDRAILWAQDVARNVSPRELEQAKLEVLSGLDMPINAFHQGLHFFETGITKDEMAAFRKGVFDCTLENVALASKYLLEPSSRALIGETI
jgi:Zn-dependent M16 (insulinase) family peptidase